MFVDSNNHGGKAASWISMQCIFVAALVMIPTITSYVVRSMKLVPTLLVVIVGGMVFTELGGRLTKTQTAKMQKRNKRKQQKKEGENCIDAIGSLGIEEKSAAQIANGKRTELDVETQEEKIQSNKNKKWNEKQKLCCEHRKVTVVLAIDEISSILGYLSWKEILVARVSSKWRDAARLTFPPQSISPRSMKTRWTTPDYYVRNRDAALALSWLSRDLPRMKTVYVNFSIPSSSQFAIAAGENAESSSRLSDDDSIWAQFGRVNQPSPSPPIDLKILESFRHLERLVLYQTDLRGSYPFLFQFKYLKSLDLTGNDEIEWDLAMLSGLPNLEKLAAGGNELVTGNLRSVRALRDTLVSFWLVGCHKIGGTVQDLADFPRLEELSLLHTKVIGDIRQFGANDFVAIKELNLPSGVYGFGDLQFIQDAPSVMLAKCYLKRRNPSLFRDISWRLAENSPQRYSAEGICHPSCTPPFDVEFVQAGPRIGWRWTNSALGGSCEVHWLDPEPDVSDNSYEKYLEEVEQIQNDVVFYRGISIPPSREDYRRRS